MEKTAATTTEDYLYSLGQLNLVYNYDFRYFSNQDGTNYGTGLPSLFVTNFLRPLC